MRILVTGGAGYVGSVLVPTLLAAGHDVVVMDIFKPACGYWIERDIYRNPVTEMDLRNTDAVIHLAGLVGEVICNREPQRAVEVNFLATKYLARACQQAEARLIFASTCSVYGVKRGISNEDTDPEPYSVYAITKLKAESDVLACGGTVFRMATIYGFSPQMRYDLIANQFIKEATENGAINVFGGDQLRPFMEIRSAARAYLACLKLPFYGEVFNLADESLSLLELGKMVGEATGCKVQVVTEMKDQRSYAIDITRARKMLNLETLSLREGIREMAAQAKTILGKEKT